MINTALVIGCILLGQVVRDDPEALRGIGVTEHLGDPLPLETQFINNAGESVRLRDYFNRERPVIMALHYSDCPMLCSLVLNGISNAVRELDFTAGEDYNLLTLSIDPEETPERSAQTASRYRKTLPQGAKPGAWTFLTGGAGSIDTLAAALGFEYFKVEKTGEYAHPAVIYILTKGGVLSRYLYGVEFDPKDLKLALFEAAAGKIGNTIDRIILSCYRYDPNAGGYALEATILMRLGGGITVVMLALGLIVLWRREKFKSPSPDTKSLD